jgi:membrane protein EpsK
LFAINTALNRVKVPGWVTLVMGVGNLLLAILLAKFCGWGLYGIAAAGAIVLTSKNSIFTPIYAAHVLKIPLSTFVKPVGAGVLLAGSSMAVGWAICYLAVIKTWPQLLLAGGLVFLFFVILGVVFSGKDREYLGSFFTVRSQV